MATRAASGPARRSVMAGFVVLGVGLLCLLALSGGKWIGRREGSAGVRTVMNEFLSRTARGFSVGAVAPSFLVGSVEGARVAEWTALLPQGGLLFYIIAGCDACEGAIRLLNREAVAMGKEARPALVILSPGSEDLLERLDAETLLVPIWIDYEDRMRLDHGIQTTRTWFRISESGTVESMGTIDLDESDYHEILKD